MTTFYTYPEHTPGTNEASASEKTPRKWKWLPNSTGVSVFISACALFVSVLALGVAIDSARATREHNKLSVRPYIGLTYITNDQGAGWVLTSNGAGPAIVNAFEATVDGKPVQTWEAVLEALGIVLQNKKFQFSIPMPGINLPSRTDPYVLLWVNPEDRTALLKNFARVHLKLVYCSLYDECWERTSSTAQLEPISAPKRKPTLSFGASQGWKDAFPN